MATDPTVFRVEAGAHVDLTERPTAVEPLYKSKKNNKKKLRKHVKKLSSLQLLH